jgi:hypothetical protein
LDSGSKLSFGLLSLKGHSSEIFSSSFAFRDWPMGNFLKLILVFGSSIFHAVKEKIVRKDYNNLG